MKKILVLSFLLLGMLPTYSQEAQWSVQAGAGVSSQNMNWSIAGNEQGTSPNILSELVWNNLRAKTYNLQTGYQISRKFGLMFLANYDHITRGSGNDSDYSEDNRSVKKKNQDFSGNKGYVYNLQLKVTYQLPNLGPLFPSIAIGPEQLGQKFYILDLPNENNGLRSTYQAQWNGGTIGLSLHYPVWLFYINGGYDFGIYDYKAEANWNIQKDFQHPLSFEQGAIGFKHYLKLQICYRITNRFDIGLSASRYYSFTAPGKDRLYRTNGEVEKTRFNGVEFSQHTGLLNIRYSLGSIAKKTN